MILLFSHLTNFLNHESPTPIEIRPYLHRQLHTRILILDQPDLLQVIPALRLLWQLLISQIEPINIVNRKQCLGIANDYG